MTTRVGTWNIGGAYTTASGAQFDYDQEDVDYFVNSLRDAEFDIVCLQEVHTKPDGSNNAEAIASALGYAHCYNVPSHPSHIRSGYQLGNAIIAQQPIQDATFAFYPYPEVPLFWKDGRPAGEKHTKHLQIVRVEDVWIANTHLLPIHLFGYEYSDESHGGAYAQDVEKVLREHFPQEPFIFCGDFNLSDPLKIFAPLRERHVSEALPTTPTRPDGKRVDHILHTPEFKVVRSGVKETERADHFLCFAELDS